MKLRLTARQAEELYVLLDTVIEESLEREGELAHGKPLIDTAHRVRRNIFNLTMPPESRLPAWTPAECSS